MPSAIASTPSPAPMTVPKLKNAWKSGMIVLPDCFSIAAPSTFIITSTAAVAEAEEGHADDDDRSEAKTLLPKPMIATPPATRIRGSTASRRRAPKRASMTAEQRSGR